MEDNSPCPMCGGFNLADDSTLDVESDLGSDAPMKNREGNEDQDQARKARLDGVMAGLRKKHMGK